jgi:small subunit ribosomal protein S13
MAKKEMKEMKGKAEGFVRLLDVDIPSHCTVYGGLTRVKGISFSIANAICNTLNIQKNKRLSELSQEEINKINSFDFSSLPFFLLNRRKDRETGQSSHLLLTKIDLAKEFDIRRMKKIKCYKGVRHSLGLPVRGQRTKSHFRKGAAVGVQKAKSKKR